MQSLIGPGTFLPLESESGSDLPSGRLVLLKPEPLGWLLLLESRGHSECAADARLEHDAEIAARSGGEDPASEFPAFVVEALEHAFGRELLERDCGGGAATGDQAADQLVGQR